MSRGHIRCLALAMCTLALPAAAQDDGGTRAEAARAAREARRATLTPPRAGRVERLLDLIETNRTVRQILAPGDGWGVRLGGIENGSGLAAGPLWRSRQLRDGAVTAQASAATSIGGDREVEAGLGLPRVGSNRISFELHGTATQLAGERFFGLGADTARADETTFRLDRRELRGGIDVEATNWLRVSGGASLLRTVAADGRARRAPAISTRFSADDTPALAESTTLRVLSLNATVDRRDVPGNPRRGGRYQLGVARYADAAHGRYSFTRVDAMVEQHLSAWKRQRVLTLRAISSGSFMGDGQDVPFYLQPSLGGSRLLRGFVTDRFRDRNLLALQAEYGFDLLPFVNAVAFYEAGTVAPRFGDLSLRNLRRDYGLGFRFGGARTVAIRTDVAFGSGEGTRLTMRFNHAF